MVRGASSAVRRHLRGAALRDRDVVVADVDEQNDGCDVRATRRVAMSRRPAVHHPARHADRRAPPPPVAAPPPQPPRLARPLHVDTTTEVDVVVHERRVRYLRTTIEQVGRQTAHIRKQRNRAKYAKNTQKLSSVDNQQKKKKIILYFFYFVNDVSMYLCVYPSVYPFAYIPLRISDVSLRISLLPLDSRVNPLTFTFRPITALVSAPVISPARFTSDTPGLPPLPPPPLPPPAPPLAWLCSERVRERRVGRAWPAGGDVTTTWGAPQCWWSSASIEPPLVQLAPQRSRSLTHTTTVTVSTSVAPTIDYSRSAVGFSKRPNCLIMI